MIVAFIDNQFRENPGISHVVYKCPAYATTAACCDKSILRTSVQGVFAIDKLWMQDNVALLAPGLQIR